jgi:hypothetical protein
MAGSSKRMAFKYGYIGFCMRGKKSVKNTVDNVLLCSGCMSFEPKDDVCRG